jgi:predicted MFS family arabinose efflux permease
VEERQIGSAGLFFGVYGIAAAAMRILGGRYYDRVPKRPLVVGALLAYGLGVGLLAVGGSTPAMVVAAILAGVSHGAVFPIISSQLVSRARTSERGSAMAIFTSIFDIALLVAAPAVGSLIDGFDYTMAFGVVSIALGLGAIVYTIWDRRLATQPAPA